MNELTTTLEQHVLTSSEGDLMAVCACGATSNAEPDVAVALHRLHVGAELIRKFARLGVPVATEQVVEVLAAHQWVRCDVLPNGDRIHSCVCAERYVEKSGSVPANIAMHHHLEEGLAYLFAKGHPAEPNFTHISDVEAGERAVFGMTIGEYAATLQSKLDVATARLSVYETFSESTGTWVPRG